MNIEKPRYNLKKMYVVRKSKGALHVLLFVAVFLLTT